MKYIQLRSGGTLHIKKENERVTVCGRQYTHLDYLPFNEDEVDLNRNAICYKCRNTRREGSRTIRDVFVRGRIEQV